MKTQEIRQSYANGNCLAMVCFLFAIDSTDVFAAIRPLIPVDDGLQDRIDFQLAHDASAVRVGSHLGTAPMAIPF